jgi:hypothetical protein
MAHMDVNGGGNAVPLTQPALRVRALLIMSGRREDIQWPDEFVARSRMSRDNDADRGDDKRSSLTSSEVPLRGIRQAFRVHRHRRGNEVVP